MARFNYTHSGKLITDEIVLERRKQIYTPLADFDETKKQKATLKSRRDKNRAKNRVAKKSRRQNRGK